MTRTIWKFPLKITDYQEIRAPSPKILHVATQHDEPCLWVEVTPGCAPRTIGIYIHGTGHILSEDCGDYIGTVLTHHDALVWHVYEAIR